MIVAFLDLLGFSSLLDTNQETAFDNLNSIHNAILTRILDNKTHPLDEYKSSKLLFDYAEKTALTSFEYMIYISDSLIIASSNVNLFISQLVDFVSSMYINYSKPFSKPFNDINYVDSDRVSSIENSIIRYHTAFPVLFRGGLSFGDDVNFINGGQIASSNFKMDGLSVSGKTYLHAVNLEKSGKGPRLFCDRSVVNELSEKNKKLIRIVDETRGIFEIIWTIGGCEACGSSTDKQKNVFDSIDDKLLPPAVHLYNYYKKDEKLEPHYNALLDLVCQGIIKYAKDECTNIPDIEEKTQELICNYLIINGINKRVDWDNNHKYIK